MTFTMTPDELAFYMYSYYYRRGVKDSEWRQRFFNEHSKELANFADILTNHPIVPPLEAFGESFGLWPNGLPPTAQLEGFLNEWAANNGTAAATPEPATADTSTPERYMMPLPTDEDTRKAQSNGDTATTEANNPNGFFVIKSANQWLKEAAERPDPEPLYKTLWFSGEACCLYADSNIGKSVLAAQIATAISQKQIVLLFDFELSGKMFQTRYTDNETKQLYDFPPKLFRCEIDPDKIDFTADFEDSLIKNIEQTAIGMDAKVIIIDNLTWLCNESEKGDAAGLLMKALHGFTRKYAWSILVIAHTPKRSLTNPIGQNDLAGSKKLMNFFDSAFAIGRSAKDENLVYIKQIKVRNDILRYGSEHVIVYEIVKNGAFLQFANKGYATEKEHLKGMAKDEEIGLRDSIIAMLNEGKTQKQAAAELGLSQSKVSRLLKK